jgi:mannosylglucosylglycerate synthase
VRAAIVSFRLGGADGISIAAGNLARCLEALGCSVTTIAGEGRPDQLIPGLTPANPNPPSAQELDAALDGVDLVVAENILTIPLDPPTSAVVAAVVADRRTLVRHFDPPWQRAPVPGGSALPHDGPHWLHVAPSALTTSELRDRGFDAHTFRPPITIGPSALSRAKARRWLGVTPSELTCLHPVRAIPRKEVPTALAIAETLGGVYWLTGAAEENYGPQLTSALSRSPVRAIRRSFDRIGLGAAYAASDVVLFPSSWEGLGLPPIEAAMCRRLAIVGEYPIATELREAGFWWPTVQEVSLVEDLLDDRESLREVVESNLAVANRHFGLPTATTNLADLLAMRGWLHDARIDLTDSRAKDPLVLV